MGSCTLSRWRSSTCAFSGCDDTVPVGAMLAVTPTRIWQLLRPIREGAGILALPQHLAHLDTAARKYAREDACLERLSLHARQARQQRRRRNQVTPIPRAIFPSLLNYVQFIPNLER